MLTTTEILLIIIITQVFQIQIQTFLRNVNSPNGELLNKNNKNYKDINTRNNVCNTSKDASTEELESIEELEERHAEFDKRIEVFKQEVESVKEYKEFAKSGEVYEVPNDFEPPSLYDHDDVEIITPAYERFMEEKLRV